MTRNSFMFGNVNSMDEWGLKVIEHDLFLPPRRSNKITIPGRSGAYSFKNDSYDERSLVLECCLTRQMSKAEFREIIFAFSQKDKIRLWDEPDKYYTGELLETDSVTVYPAEIMREFELEFICDPFALSDVVTKPVQTGHNSLHYQGTARAPCVITLRNMSSFDVSNITITAIKRRR